MIDVHCHILPGIDDGAADLDEAVEMASALSLYGVSDVFATPHVSSASEIRSSIEIPHRVSSLQAELEGRGIPLRLHPGAEVFPSLEILAAVDAGLPITLGKARRFILLGPALSMLPVGMAELIFQLRLRDVTPILAHPERVLTVQRETSRLESLVGDGLLLQVNLGSLMGLNGRDAEKAAAFMLRRGWVHFLATDSHRASNCRVLDRIGDLGRFEGMSDLLAGNGSRVIQGREIRTSACLLPEERGRFGFLRRLFGFAGRK